MRVMRSHFLRPLPVLFLALSPAIAIDPPCETGHLFPSPVESISTQLGISVALSGDLLIAGANFGNYCVGGEARLFRETGSGFLLEQVLELPPSSNSYGLGRAVAIDGAAACIGASQPWPGYLGEAHVFRLDPILDEWVHEQILSPADGSAFNSFGTSLDMSGDWIVIGAQFDDELGADSGAAYIFHRDPISGVWSQAQKLMTPAGATGVHYGRAVAIQGDTILVGAPHHGTTGMVFVHRFDPVLGSWSLVQSIQRPSGQQWDEFGFSVSIHADLAVIGAPGAETGGAAFVYRQDPSTAAWLEEDALIPSDGDLGDLFGWAVSGAGDSIAVGAFGNDEFGDDHGAVYLFLHQPVTGTWSEEQKLSAANGGEDDHFGHSVAIGPDLVAIGRPYADLVEDSSGAVHVFTPTGGPGSWTESQMLATTAPGAAKEFLGTSVDMSGEVAIAGAPGDKDQAPGSGSATIYRYDAGLAEWHEEAKLLGSYGSEGDEFGISVAIDEDLAVVGAWWDETVAPKTGSAYVFRRDLATGNWLEEQRLIASDADTGDVFGVSVDVSGDVIAVGARGDDALGPERGAAYLFRRDSVSGTWVEEQKIVGAGSPYNRFGHTLSLEADVLMVGSMLGSAIQVYRYDFQAHFWSLHPAMAPWESIYNSEFGASIDLSGNRVIVGESRDDELGLAAGAAHVFLYDGQLDFWLAEAKLLAPDGQQEDKFGRSVALSGDFAVVGAPGVGANGSTIGKVYLYRRSAGTSEWEFQVGWSPEGASLFEELGSAVACWGTQAVVGAPRSDAGCTDLCTSCDSGSVHAFELTACLVGEPFIRGDANADGQVDIADAVQSLAQLFGPAAPTCFDAQDANDDGDHDFADPIATISALFSAGAPLPSPFPTCGHDPFDGEMPTECPETACP